MSDVQCSLVLSNEIATVATALRQYSKNTILNRYEDDEIIEDPLLEDFLSLRQKIHFWDDWEQVDPFEYLDPFLDAVKSKEVNAAITGIALESLWRLIISRVISVTTVNAKEALQKLIEAVKQCKFEPSNRDVEEAVLTKLYQLLVAVVCSDVGVLLTATDIENIFYDFIQKCEEGIYTFPMSNGTSLRKFESSRMFSQSLRHMLGEFVCGLYSRLNTCVVVDGGGGGGGSTTNPGVNSEDIMAINTGNNPEIMRNNSFLSNSGNGGIGMGGSGGGGGAGGGVLEESRSYMDRSSSVPNAVMHLYCGIEPLVEIMDCFITIAGNEISSNYPSDHVEDENVLFGLQMIHMAIVNGGHAISYFPQLLSLIRQKLFYALSQALKRAPQPIHAAVFQIVLAMYKLFGDHLLLQMESFFKTAIFSLCEGKGLGPDYHNQSQEHQEVALEAVLDFCGYPGFLRDIYLNLDCRIERSNLFEDICALLSKTAFPVKSTLTPVHMISLEGLLAMLFTLSSGCTGDGLMISIAPEPDTELPHYIDIWSDLFMGLPPKLGEVFDFSKISPHESENVDVLLIRFEKAIKQKIALSADHFNKDFKKGFQYLQAMQLLPVADNVSDIDPEAIAKFLRVCPDLDKTMIGELLGDAKEFYIRVLECYTELFDFTGKSVDTGLRMFFDTFKVPGEAQKINRVVENFARVYYTQQGENGIFKSEDSIHVLSYSIIMLNTDLHNPEVKIKMTMDQFIKNNRGINNNEDFPREMLEEIYKSIESNPIKLQTATTGGDLPMVRWVVLDQMSDTVRGNIEKLDDTSSLDRDMFILIWGPPVAAITVILDQANDLTSVQTALTGMKLAAKLAGYYGVDEVIDNIVVSLLKFTSILNLNHQKPSCIFGTNRKAQLATESAFFIANRYSDSMRSAGWRSIVDCVVRLCQLNLIPHNFWEENSASVNAGEESDALLSTETFLEVSGSKSGSIGNANNSFSANSLTNNISAVCWSFASREMPPSPEEQAAQKSTIKCIDNCRVRDVFRDTAFLQMESLKELVLAINWVSVSGSHPLASSGAKNIADEKVAMLSLDLLLYIASCNRDRIQLLWPFIHKHFEDVVSSDGSVLFPRTVMENIVLNMLKICQRILPYKPEVSGTLLNSLQLIPNLEPELLKDMSEKLSLELLTLIKNAAAYIRHNWAWATIFLLLRMPVVSTKGFEFSLEAFAKIAKNGEHLSSSNFSDCLNTGCTFIDKIISNGPATIEHNKDKVVQLINLLLDMAQWLPNWNESNLDSIPSDESTPGKDSLSDEMEPNASSESLRSSSPVNSLLDILQALCHYSQITSDSIRNAAALNLHQCIMFGGEHLPLEDGNWGYILQNFLLKLVKNLIEKIKDKEYREIDKTIRTVIKTVSKTLLLFLAKLRKLPQFPIIWLEILNVLQGAANKQNAELAEAVPEEAKNMLLVMSKEGILKKKWKDETGANLWEATWRKARIISFSLTPDILIS